MNAPWDEVRQNVMESLVTLPAWDADRVRVLVDRAIREEDPEELRLEAQRWSGWVGLALRHLADRLEVDNTPGCGWNSLDAVPFCDWDPECPVHGGKGESSG